MDPLLEKYLFLVVDKGLLACAGSIIALVTAKALERYRRKQAVLLELGKLRAQALARVVALIGEQEILISSLLEFGKKSERTSKFLEDTMLKLEASIQEMEKSFTRDSALLDRPLRESIGLYGMVVHQLNPPARKFGEIAQSDAALQLRRENLDRLRKEIMRYLPPLPKHDD